MTEVRENVLLAPYSTFRIGGPADHFVEPATKSELRDAVNFARSGDLPLFLLGGGSNILFADEGFRGLVIRPGFSSLVQSGNEIFQVGSGVSNADLFAFAKQRGYDYSPFLTVPGTLGGAIAGNAGIPGHEVGNLLVSAEIFDIAQMRFRRVNPEFFQFRYRHTVFHQQPELRKRIIITGAEIRLPQLPETEIDTKARQYVSVRKEKQPWGKTGGSFFKNPSVGAAGYFLEQAGFKGKRHGDAFFSEKHANFMMNAGQATQKQVIELASQARDEVCKRFGVELQSEVRVVDEWGSAVDFFSVGLKGLER